MAKARSDARRRGRHVTRSRAELRRNPKRFRAVLAALSALLSCPVWAAKWEVVPTLAVGETYSDNISLAPDASKRGDWFTQVTPGISVAAAGTGLRFNATYNPEVIYYAHGQSENQIFQRGTAAGTAELSKQLLFVDVGAKIDQYDVSLRAPLTTSNGNTTGNRATVRTYFASPYLRRDFGSDLHAEARFTASAVNSDNPSAISNGSSSLSNSAAQRVDLNLGSGPAYKLLTWNADYSREAINYTNAQDTVSEIITASGRRLITATVGLVAQVGYESYDFGAFVPASEGSSWSAGFDWTPSPRTRLKATAGRRFYGDAYLLDFSHRTRLTTWSAGFTQSITSTRSEFFVPVTASTAGYLDTLFMSQFPDPVARQKAVDAFIARTGLPPGLSAPINFFSSQLFLVKRWQASAGILGVRNVLIANVFKETREGLVGSFVLPGAGDFATNKNVDQTGMSVQWNLRLTAQDTWNLNGAYIRNEFPGTGQVDNLTHVEMGLARQFQPRLYGSLNYRRHQNDSNQTGSSFTENAVLAKLQIRF